MNCEFCKSTKDVVKKETSEKGEVRYCSACKDKASAREQEIDDIIISRKAYQLAQYQKKYSVLKTELEKDVYEGLSSTEIIERLNNVDLGIHDSLPASCDNFKKCFYPGEFLALTSNQKENLSVLVSGGSIDLSDENTKTIVSTIFPEGTKTRTALIEKQKVKRSIAYNLGYGIVKNHDIERVGLI